MAFDGTGYGLEGTVWGGEFLLATLSGFTVLTHSRVPCHDGGIGFGQAVVAAAGDRSPD